MDNLFMILGFISLIGIIFSTFQLTKDFIKNKRLDRQGKLMVFIVLFIISIIGFNREPEENIEVENTETVLTEGKETIEEVQREEPVIEEVKEPSIEEKENIALNSMRANFSDFAEINLNRESKTFNITPTGEARLAISLFSTFQKNNKELRENWNFITTNLKEISKTMEKDLPGYYLAILDPNNTNKELLKVHKGEIIYNFIEN